MPSSTPQTGGEIGYDIGGDNISLNGGRRFGKIVERATGAGASGYLQLTKQLPPNSKIVYATMYSRNQITPRLSSSAACTAGQAAVVLISGTGLPTQGVTNTTSAIVAGTVQTAFGASLASGARARWPAAVDTSGAGRAITGYMLPNATVAHNLYILPYVAVTAPTMTGSFFVRTSGAQVATDQNTLNGTGTATSGTTTADFDVAVFYEEYLDTPAT